MPHEEDYVQPLQSSKKFDPKTIPESFDVRKAWPECAAIVGHVRDQSNCGSCWAFGSTEVTINDLIFFV